jgi:hypothetical protein
MNGLIGCLCTLKTKLVDDGCEICNPAKALEYAKETIADLEQQAILRDLEIVRLREALDRSRVAIDDWLNLYASEMCDEARVEEARKRTNENGTLYYIATVQRTNREVLSTPIDLSALTAYIEGLQRESLAAEWERIHGFDKYGVAKFIRDAAISAQE